MWKEMCAIRLISRAIFAIRKFRKYAAMKKTVRPYSRILKVSLKT